MIPTLRPDYEVAPGIRTPKDMSKDTRYADVNSLVEVQLAAEIRTTSALPPGQVLWQLQWDVGTDGTKGKRILRIHRNEDRAFYFGAVTQSEEALRAMRMRVFTLGVITHAERTRLEAIAVGTPVVFSGHPATHMEWAEEVMLRAVEDNIFAESCVKEAMYTARAKNW